MIGQNGIKQALQRLSSIPRAFVIVGDAGSGRGTLGAYIARNHINAPIVEIDHKIDTIREMLHIAYKQNTPTVYLLQDLGLTSLAAQNALLKVIEEPPNNAYFIITISNETEIPPTLLSRAYVLTMERYSHTDLQKYADSLDLHLGEGQLEALLKYATNPRDIRILSSYVIEEFALYIDRVVESLHKASIPNMFKIADKIKTKKDGDGWDLAIFLDAVSKKMQYLHSNNPSRVGVKEIYVTMRKAREARRKGANNQYIIDTWLLEIRECRI